MIKNEFLAVFQISKMISFEVNYYTLGGNEKPHFATRANLFVRNKRDYLTCGQCQEDILPKGSKAYKFFTKWDKLHLNDLTEKQYENLIKDLEDLKATYNYIYRDLKDEIKPYNPQISFYDEVVLSKKELKKAVL